MIIDIQVLADSAIFSDTQFSVQDFQNGLFNLIVTQQQSLYFENGDSLIGRVTKPEREFAEGSAGLKEIAHGAATTISLLIISVNVVGDVAIDQSNNIVDEQRIEQVKKEVVDKLNAGKHLVQGGIIVYELIDGKIKASKKKVDEQAEKKKTNGQADSSKKKGE
jgi:hypothetical protein